MKNKVKSIVLSLSFFYMITIIILMMITYCNMKENIELSSNDGYKNELNEYREMVNILKNSRCKNYMNTLMDKVEKDISTNKISLREYYESINSDDNLLSYYVKAKDDCISITNEKMQEMNMPIKFLTSSIFGDEMFRDYIYQYELSILDKKTRDINAANLIPVENNIKVNNELNIIKELIENIDWEKEV